MTASDIELADGWVLKICIADRGMAYTMVGTFPVLYSIGKEKDRGGGGGGGGGVDLGH